MQALSYLAVFVFFISACSQNKSEPTINPSSKGFNFDIKTRWHIQKKSCGDLSLSSGLLDEFRFDANHVVRIESNENNESRCDVAYVFERIINDTSQSGASLKEQGLLRGSRAKKKCYEKNNASRKPTEDVISFGPEEFDYSLTKDANQIQKTLQNNPNCTNGELKLELTSTKTDSK